MLDEIRSGGPPIRKENGSGEPLSYHVINRVVTRWTRRHLAVRLTPHKLRHAYGKHCLDQGVDIRIIAEAVGLLRCDFSQGTQPIPAGLNFQKESDDVQLGE